MKLPNADKAVIDIRKLTEYCLNKEHPRGKYKARVFASVFGLTQESAEELKQELARRIKDENCIKGESDVYGDRYIVDFMYRRNDKEAKIRSTWIIKKEEAFPRLTSCYIL